MIDLLQVVLPVFLVIGFGYVVAWRHWFSETAYDNLMQFSQQFAIPCLLFKAISEMDLGAIYDLSLLSSYYAAALLCFAVGLFGARLIFGRPWEDCVIIGVACLYSNTVLLGLPIMERGYGPESLGPNYAIISVHSPIALGVGITVMEIVRARGKAGGQLLRTVLKAMFKNTLIIGLGLGFIVNIGQITLPVVLSDGIALMARAALPVALFGLGGILYRYRPEGDVRTIVFMCAVSLILHPSLVWIFAGATGLGIAGLQSAIVTSAMPPGVNAYILAHMYGVAKRVTASTVLIGTVAAIGTVSVWLAILP